jgi:magnesium chelatase subunit D
MKPRSTRSPQKSKPPLYPFVAIVGQEEMKLALILNVIDPLIGGVLIMGHRGTGKSTAVRGLAELLPEIDVVGDCPYQCDPKDRDALCDACRTKARTRKLRASRLPVRVVDLPLGATEDRVCGTIDIERALRSGTKAFEPGLLARANRGFLYIDEVNLLDDHLVNLLLDAAATGRNRVEREGISVEHQARFVLVGSGNPEEGELRPQLQDRFGFHVEVTTDNSVASRVAVIEKREAFERNSETFRASVKQTEDRIREQISRARKAIDEIEIDAALLNQIATLCSQLKIDGHRGELTISRAARALAAFEQRKHVTADDVKRVAVMSLRHRLRRDGMEETPGARSIEDALDEVFPEDSSRVELGDQNRGEPSGPAESVSKLPELSKSKSKKHHAGFSKATSRAARSKVDPERGSYRRAIQTKSSRVAIDATLRAAALTSSRSVIGPEAMRYKLFARKSGSLFIFAIDTSGSMALNRIHQAKGALLQLLKRSYVNRDRVTVIAFRNTEAKVLLPPSRSILRARRVLDGLSVGGGTPIAAALATSLDLARLESRKQDGEKVLLVFTDGRANVPLRSATRDAAALEREMASLGAELRNIGVKIVVVETQHRFALSDDARRLSEILFAEHVRVNPIHKHE